MPVPRPRPQTTSAHPSESAPFAVVAVAASCVAFVVIGAFQALYGPAIPALRSEFGISPATAGLALSAHFVGALLGVLAFHLGWSALGNRSLLGLSYLLMAVGAIGFGLAPGWPTAVVSALVTGLGFGGIDYGLNQLFSLGFGDQSPAMLNLLNAHFGVGAIAAPAAIGWIGADGYPWIFGGLAVICLALLLTLGGVRPRTPHRAVAEAGSTPPGSPRVVPIITSFVLVYVLHVAIETGVGGWEPTHLEAVGYGAATAATATSAYWLAMTAGRFLAVPLSLRWHARSILPVCCLGMAACLLLATIPSVAPYAYLGVGLAIAPIFPTCLPWLNRTVPGVAGAGAYVIAASMIGGVAFPPLLGTAIERFGVRSVPQLLLIIAVVCAGLGWWLRRNAVPPTAACPDRTTSATPLMERNG